MPHFTHYSRTWLATLALSVSCFACTQNQSSLPAPSSESPIMTTADLVKQLDFKCVHEQRPPISPESELLYQYARYQDLHNRWLPKAGVYDSVLHFYRIAAAHDNYKAIVRLQFLLAKGDVHVIGYASEMMALNQQLMRLMPAAAHYNLASYLYRGNIVDKHLENSLTYLRRAAELGSADAQFELAEQIIDLPDQASLQYRIALSDKLYKCAAEQQHARAGAMLGAGYKMYKKYPEALWAYQQGAKGGDMAAITSLAIAFEDNGVANTGYLGQKPDPDRVKRYDAIATIMSDYRYLKSKMPDLDEIVPLPPAKLPPWDGTTAFQRWFEAPSPAKPSDELVAKLAAAKNLDPKTGLPLKDDDTPAKPKVHKGFF